MLANVKLIFRYNEETAYFNSSEGNDRAHGLVLHSGRGIC